MQQPSYNGPPVYSLYEAGSVNTSGLHSHSVGAVVKDDDKTINLGHQTPIHLRDFWAIIIATGAAISVCPICEHIEVGPMGDETKKQYVTVTGEGLTIHGWKEVTILVGCISLQISFVVANVQSALLGLPDLNKNLDNCFKSRYNPSLPTTVLFGDIEDLSQQADIPRQLRQPPQPTKQEQETHRLTHMPYKSWCPICMKSKGQPVHHRRGGLKEQSVIQLDYAYTRANTPTAKKWQVHTVPTCIERMTGLCMAIPTSR
eukprot:4855670-Amphidinium_carterae.3